MKKIFKDEKSIGLEDEYYKLFERYPTWYYQQESVDECYSRVRKEIAQKKEELKKETSIGNLEYYDD